MVNLTNKLVASVKPPRDKKYIRLWDSNISGFGLRVTDKGVKSFIFECRQGLSKKTKQVHERAVGTGIPSFCLWGEYCLFVSSLTQRFSSLTVSHKPVINLNKIYLLCLWLTQRLECFAKDEFLVRRRFLFGRKKLKSNLTKE